MALVGRRQDAHGWPQFKPLLETTRKDFTIKEISADKAYSSRENLEAVAEAGGAQMALGNGEEQIAEDGMSPLKMLERMRNEVVRYGAHIQSGRVHRVYPRTDGLFDVHSSSGSVTARTIVLATGLVDQVPGVKGLSKTWGNDLRICPCYDGNEMRNQRFVVFGVQERLAQLASWVSVWSPRVTLITEHELDRDGLERLGQLGISVVRDEVSGLVHKNGRLVAVSNVRGRRIDCDAAWVAMRWKAASDLAVTLCEVDGEGLARVDQTGKTSRPGVFAIGNASNPIAHLAHATAEGTNVGPHVTNYLLKAKVTELRAQRQQGPE
jgi:thioredoxin reductase